LLVSLCLVSILLPGRAATPAENFQIEADQAFHHIDRNETLYRGRVTITREDFEVNADELTIHTSENQVVFIKATGDPVRFRHRQPGSDAPPVVGQAREIEFHAREGLLQLDGDASITRAREFISAARILYRLDDGKLSANAADDDAGDRVRTVIRLPTPSETRDPSPDDE